MAFTEQYGEGEFENHIGLGPDANELPYYRVVSSAISYFWPSIGLGSSQSQSINVANSHYSVQGRVMGLNPWIVSDIAPHSGTYHLLQDTTTEDANANVYFGNLKTESSDIYPVGFRATSDDKWQITAEVAMSGAPVGDAHFEFRIDTFNMAGDFSNLHVESFSPTFADGTYDTHTLTIELTDLPATHTHMVVFFASFFDAPNIGQFQLDSVTIGKEVQTNFVRNTGFRFPYSRWT